MLEKCGRKENGYADTSQSPSIALRSKKYFPSMTVAAEELGVSRAAICKAMERNKPVRGLKFYRKSVWDKITQKKL